MLDYSVYKVVHIGAALMIFASVGGVATHVANQGGDKSHRWRKPLSITHGIGLLLSLVAGFGLHAKMAPELKWGGWIFAKIAIWLVLGGITAMLYRKPQASTAAWWGTLALGFAAAFLAIYKPF